MMKYIELAVSQHNKIRDALVDDEVYDSDTWVEQLVEIYLTTYNADKGEIVNSVKIGSFASCISTHERRAAASHSLFDEFDRCFPEFCFLIPGWECKDGKHITAKDGWKINVERITDRYPQVQTIFVIGSFLIDEQYRGKSYGLEALSIYFDAYADCESFALLGIYPISDKLQITAEGAKKLKNHFGQLGFRNVGNDVMLKDFNYSSAYKRKGVLQ